MGQQLAEDQLIRALDELPKARAIRPEPVDVTTLRSPLAAERRLPLDKLHGAPWLAQLACGRWAYRGYDLVHRLDLRLPPGPASEVLTIHDLAPLRFRDEGSLPRGTAKAVRRASAVVCPSAFSAAEVRDEFGVNDVEVIPNGLDPAFLNPQPLSEHERRSLGLPQRWVLHIGGATTRKNLGGLATAWRAVRGSHADVGLVLCGPSDSRRTQLFEPTPGVHLLGKVPRPTLVGLVASAAAVVVPSTYEGYGLPAVEAMACGTPVVATAASSLPEVTGSLATLVDVNADALAEGIRHVLCGDVSSATLVQARALARSRTWDSAADAYYRIYERVLANQHLRPG